MALAVPDRFMSAACLMSVSPGSSANLQIEMLKGMSLGLSLGDSARDPPHSLTVILDQHFGGINQSSHYHPISSSPRQPLSNTSLQSRFITQLQVPDQGCPYLPSLQPPRKQDSFVLVCSRKLPACSVRMFSELKSIHLSA